METARAVVTRQTKQVREFEEWARLVALRQGRALNDIERARLDRAAMTMAPGDGEQSALDEWQAKGLRANPALARQHAAAGIVFERTTRALAGYRAKPARRRKVRR